MSCVSIRVSCIVIWIVDKKVVPHLIERNGQLAELPVRISFEYAVEDGEVVKGSLSMNTLYNKSSVTRHFPGMDGDCLEREVQATAERAVDEHLALCGYGRP